MHIFTGILIFKGLPARCHYKSFGVKGLKHLRKKFLHIQEFTKNNTGNKMAPTTALIFSGLRFQTAIGEKN
jgi:hypothetical protein